MSFTVHGLAVSQGIAIGHAHLVSHALLEVAHFTVAPKHVDAEVARLRAAVARVKADLAGLKASSGAGTAPSEVDAFVGMHIMFLEDPMLVGAAETLILTRRANAEWALVQQMELLVEQFEAIEDAYLRERKADVVQVVERVVKVLLGHPGHLPPKRKDGLGTIIVAHDLSPTDTIGFKDHAVAGFITDVGGPTGHTAIVARSLSIPAVVAGVAPRMSVRISTPLPLSTSSTRRRAMGRASRGSSWPEMPSCMSWAGRRFMTWLTHWTSASPRVPWVMRRTPIM